MLKKGSGRIEENLSLNNIYCLVVDYIISNNFNFTVINSLF